MLPADAGPISTKKSETPLIENHLVTTIQVSAFRDRDEAEKEVRRLKESGVDGRISYETAANKGKWYRVYVGRFDSEYQAHLYAKRLKEDGIITWSWVKPAALSPAVVQPAQPVLAESPSPVSTTLTTLADTAPSPITTTAVAAVSIAQPAQPVEDSVDTFPLSTAYTTTDNVEAEQTKVENEALQEEEDEPFPVKPFEIRSQTTLRTFKRGTTQGKDDPVMPLFQYLQLDYGDAEEGGWSAHAYGWGRYDLADSAYFEDTADGIVLYGYLEYRKPYSSYFMNLGRQHILNGVTNDSVDGLQVGLGFGEMLSARLFGGVTSRTEASSTDLTYGGRMAIHPQPSYELGLSYQNTDLEDEPEQKVGVDFSLNFSHWLTFQGLSSYNLKSEDWREHSYSASLRYGDFSLAPNYQFFNYQDYFGSAEDENSLFHFLRDSEEQLTIVGGDIQWQGMSPITLGVRYNHYTYHLRQEDADYYAGLLNVDVSGGSQIGAEVGRMDGETVDNAYSLYRAYFFWSAPFGLKESTFISGDGIYQFYDAPIFGRDDATNYSLSAGMRFFDDALEVKLTGYYNQDPYFDEDVEGVFTLHYKY